jgi:hypothetical protein
VGVGLILLLKELGIVQSGWNLLVPIFIVFLGVRIILGPNTSRWTADSRDFSGTLEHFAILSGITRKITSQEFTGGSLGAVCGGWDIDLREAGIAGDEAVVDVFCFWGGGDIRIPADWEVVARVQPLLGGVSVKAQAPNVAPGTTPKRLVLTGMAVMGGVEVKN